MIVNMPSGGGSNALIWDISGDLQTESRDVSTMPRSITYGYVTKLNDTFYMLGGGDVTDSPSAQTSYKYVDGEWVEDTVLGSIAIYKKYYAWDGVNVRNNTYSNSGGLVSNNNMLYYTEFNNNSATTYGAGTVYKYDGTTKTSETRYFGTDNSSSYRYGTIGIVASSTDYKVLGLASGKHDSSTSTLDAEYNLNIGGTTRGSYETLDSSMFGTNDVNSIIIKPHSQGVYHAGRYVYLVSKKTHIQGSSKVVAYQYHYYLAIVNNNGLLIRVIEVPDGVKLVTDMVEINGYVYLTNESGMVMRWSYNTMQWEVVNNLGNGSLVELDGEIHRFYGTYHTAHKLYRTAKTYAPKGTNIYLPYDAAAVSTNLQPIEGGFTVTESGNVELKIYDF